MDIFTDWIRNIVFITITITLLNMIIPDSMGKYVKVIAGFLVMLIVVKPAADLIHADVTLDTLFVKHTSIINQQNTDYNVMDSGAVSQNQDELTVKVFKEKLSKDIQNKLSDEIGYETEVNIEINEDLDNENFGELLKANVLITNKIDDDTVKTIPKVEIMDNQEENKEIIDNKLVKKINNFFFNFYNLSDENITINKKNKNTG